MHGTWIGDAAGRNISASGSRNTQYDHTQPICMVASCRQLSGGAGVDCILQKTIRLKELIKEMDDSTDCIASRQSICYLKTENKLDNN